MDLAATAKRIVAEGRGVLAADERPSSLQKRFEPIGIRASPENQRAYRELLFTTSDVSSFIGGVILFPTSLTDRTTDGTPFPELLLSRHQILPGVKVDEGVEPLAGAENETVTAGLDRSADIWTRTAYSLRHTGLKGDANALVEHRQ